MQTQQQFRLADRGKGFIPKLELSDDGMVVVLAAVVAGVDIVICPPPPDVWVADREVTDKVRQFRIVSVSAGVDA